MVHEQSRNEVSFSKVLRIERSERSVFVGNRAEQESIVRKKIKGTHLTDAIKIIIITILQEQQLIYWNLQQSVTWPGFTWN